MVGCTDRLSFPGLRSWGKFFLFLAMALLLAGCSQGSKSGEELRGEIKDLKGEIQDLKKEIKSMQEKLDKLQAGQQAMLALLQKPIQPPPAAESVQPPLPQVLTVSQLLANKDRYLGSRVMVRGMVGPVIMHHKSLLLVAPEGMVEVLLGSLPDEKTVVRLTSTPLEKPITVTGIVSLPAPGTSGAKLQITAEAVEF
jgi:outer membrane murein-binding lipoprotein Lpp